MIFFANIERFSQKSDFRRDYLQFTSYSVNIKDNFPIIVGVLSSVRTALNSVSARNFCNLATFVTTAVSRSLSVWSLVTTIGCKFVTIAVTL